MKKHAPAAAILSLLLLGAGCAGAPSASPDISGIQTTPAAAPANPAPPSSIPLYFTSQIECEQKTDGPCRFETCDYVPAGQTYEEVCGPGPGKRWVPSK